MLSYPLTEIASFDNKRKNFVLSFGPFHGPFFHQGLEWFLFVLFLTVLAFTHVSRSLSGFDRLRGKQQPIAYRSLPPQAPTASLTTTPVFRPFSRLADNDLLSSSSLRASKEGRLGFVLRPTGLFQHLRNPFPHDIHDIVREQMVASTLNLLPDGILAHRILSGHS